MAQEMTPLGLAAEYWTDAWQRGALFLEIPTDEERLIARQTAEQLH
jgi:hypothetical protein